MSYHIAWIESGNQQMLLLLLCAYVWVCVRMWYIVNVTFTAAIIFLIQENANFQFAHLSWTTIKYPGKQWQHFDVYHGAFKLNRFFSHPFCFVLTLPIHWKWWNVHTSFPTKEKNSANFSWIDCFNNNKNLTECLHHCVIARETSILMELFDGENWIFFSFFLSFYPSLTLSLLISFPNIVRYLPFVHNTVDIQCCFRHLKFNTM